MRVLQAASLLALGAALAAGGGCLRTDTGAVLLHFIQPVDLSPALTTYSSSSAAVAFDPAGPVLFTATSNEGTLTLVLPGPLATGTTIALSPTEESVHFAFDAAAWGNQGGSVFILSADPAIVRLDGVPMVARNDSTVGSFVFTGAGTFR
jgi:hypothetical protein